MASATFGVTCSMFNTMKRSAGRRILFGILALPAITYATAVVGIYASQRQMLIVSSLDCSA